MNHMREYGDLDESEEQEPASLIVRLRVPPTPARPPYDYSRQLPYYATFRDYFKAQNQVSPTFPNGEVAAIPTSSQPGGDAGSMPLSTPTSQWLPFPQPSDGSLLPTNTYASPSVSNAYAIPSAANAYAAPPPTNAYTAPPPANAYTAPPPTNAYTAPLAANTLVPQAGPPHPPVHRALQIQNLVNPVVNGEPSSM